MQFIVSHYFSTHQLLLLIENNIGEIDFRFTTSELRTTVLQHLFLFFDGCWDVDLEFRTCSTKYISKKGVMMGHDMDVEVVAIISVHAVVD
jgi:hypothetical protein